MSDELTAAYMAGYQRAEAKLREQNTELMDALKQIANRGVPTEKEKTK